MGAGRFTEEQIHPLGVLRIETERSIWFVTAERYQRLPREEEPRPATPSIDLSEQREVWRRQPFAEQPSGAGPTPLASQF